MSRLFRLSHDVMTSFVRCKTSLTKVPFYLNSRNSTTILHVRSNNCSYRRTARYFTAMTAGAHDDSARSNDSFLRGPNQNDIEILSSFLDSGSGSALTNPSDLEKYNSDWTNHYKGNSNLVLKPQTTTEISKILAYCNQEKIGIVPQAGNTGLVGGSVPETDGKSIILSTENLNQIHSFDPHNGILICDAGCILQNLQQYLENYQEDDQPCPYMFPLDIGAKGTCQIGGNISTNAGGQYYYRHGSLHANILGLEVVKADGSILNLMSTNRKDNTGYDLKHLFIGAEGTLGIVTKVSISCPPLPNARNATFLGLDSMENVLKVLSLAKQELGEILSAFELMDSGILDLVDKHYPIPIHAKDGKSYRFSLLVETQGSHMEHDMAKMESFLEKCLESELVRDGILCQDGKQIQEMWQIRESCNPIIAKQGYTYKYDISIPLSEFYTIATEIQEQLATNAKYPHALAVVWGHTIDGNAHLNVVIPGKYEEDAKFSKWLESNIYEKVTGLNGSISAEHGLGQCKRQYLTMVKDPLVLDLMFDVKRMLDPIGIMNPGKYLPDRA